MTTFCRFMIRADMATVLDIEQATSQAPWREEDFRHFLRERNCIGMVAERDNRVVGFLLYDLRKTSYYIWNLAVAPPMQRRGVGRRMVEKMIHKLSTRRTVVGTEIRETNLAAQLFFKQCGFRATNILYQHYDDTSEDGYQMEYRVAQCRFDHASDGYGRHT